MNNADLSGDELQGTDLSKVDSLWRVMSLTETAYDKATKWPDGFNPEAFGALFFDNSDHNS